jgi:hypothetical protein
LQFVCDFLNLKKITMFPSLFIPLTVNSPYDPELRNNYFKKLEIIKED